MQRTAAGSKSLRPETSDNCSIGFVFEPVEGLTITYDKWSIEKSDTIGLFGEENHIALDLLRRLSAGTSNCNPAVVRLPIFLPILCHCLQLQDSVLLARSPE
ncbi:MAG: hypothetical protein O3B02_07030 [Proteobacteria bacterium]|nr:hypothetical protein [Pseudomonadota bacterium]MDA0896153.1 hypothetical protein [Pseudomonadota bacterium]MDA1244739.1 hypothetical protein [Pseudomonadota bacterium]